MLWCFHGLFDPFSFAAFAGLEAYQLQLEALAQSFLWGVPQAQLISTF